MPHVAFAWNDLSAPSARSILEIVVTGLPLTNGASKADMMARLAVIVGENLGPMSIGLEVFPA